MWARRLAIWPTLPLNVYFRNVSQWLPYPLGHEGCRVFSRARHAIWNACHALGLGNNDVILVPAYHHGCEIEALLQADVQIRYYEVTDLLEPDPASLQSLLTPEVRVLYLIHYLGFPQDAIRWRQWCDDRGLLLFEDAAQSFLAEIDNRPVGSFGHTGVYCLYKTYGIPDGGAVISVAPPALPASERQPGRWSVFKRHVNWLAERWAVMGGLHLFIKPIMKQMRTKKHRPYKEFELGDPASPPSAMTMQLLSKIVDTTTAERRRENYKYLLSRLESLVPRPFSSLPEGACPFAFPIEVNDATEVLKRLRRYGVEGLLFWRNAHPSLPAQDFPVSMALRERVFAVPVHQELTQSELQQIADAVLRSVNKNQETRDKNQPGNKNQKNYKSERKQPSLGNS